MSRQEFIISFKCCSIQYWKSEKTTDKELNCVCCLIFQQDVSSRFRALYDVATSYSLLNIFYFRLFQMRMTWDDAQNGRPCHKMLMVLVDDEVIYPENPRRKKTSKFDDQLSHMLTSVVIIDRNDLFASSAKVSETGNLQESSSHIFELASLTSPTNRRVACLCCLAVLAEPNGCVELGNTEINPRAQPLVPSTNSQSPAYSQLCSNRNIVSKRYFGQSSFS